MASEICADALKAAGVVTYYDYQTLIMVGLFTVMLCCASAAVRDGAPSSPGGKVVFAINPGVFEVNRWFQKNEQNVYLNPLMYQKRALVFMLIRAALLITPLVYLYKGHATAGLYGGKEQFVRDIMKKDPSCSDGTFSPNVMYWVGCVAYYVIFSYEMFLMVFQRWGQQPTPGETGTATTLRFTDFDYRAWLSRTVASISGRGKVPARNTAFTIAIWAYMAAFAVVACCSVMLAVATLGSGFCTMQIAQEAQLLAALTFALCCLFLILPRARENAVHTDADAKEQVLSSAGFQQNLNLSFVVIMLSTIGAIYFSVYRQVFVHLQCNGPDWDWERNAVKVGAYVYTGGTSVFMLVRMWALCSEAPEGTFPCTCIRNTVNEGSEAAIDDSGDRPEVTVLLSAGGITQSRLTRGRHSAGHVELQFV